MGINNPVPQNLGKESKKAAKILASFVKPNQLVSYDAVIPPRVLQNAKGLMILTVLKAGFLFSGRAGSGVIVARLPDGTWSPPSAVMTGGAGVGGQIGAELTDFIFILNTREAVETFSRSGSVTLGGNVSLAAGPLGRNAEAAGGLSTGNVSAVFSYAKTKGLFAGVSLEGSAIIERREANRKFYGSSNCTSQHILSGKVTPPRACAPLFQVLDSKAFRPNYVGDYGSDIYDDIPDFDSTYESDYSRGYTDDYERRSSGYRGGTRSGSRPSGRYNDDIDDRDSYDDGYHRSGGGAYASDRYDDRPRDRERDRYAGDRDRTRDRYADRDRYGERDRYGSADRYGGRDQDRYSRDRDQDRYETSGGRGSTRETDRRRDKDGFATADMASGTRARALYTFAGEEDGDLGFKKGDVFRVVEKSDSTDDWWTGEFNGKKGIFPANYVQII